MGAVLLLACSGHGKTYMGKIYTELNTGMHMPSLTFMYTLTYVCKTLTRVCILAHMYVHTLHIHASTTLIYMYAQPFSHSASSYYYIHTSHIH